MKYFYDQLVQKIVNQQTMAEFNTPGNPNPTPNNNNNQTLANIPNSIELNVRLNANTVFRIKLMIYEILPEQENILDSESEEDIESQQQRKTGRDEENPNPKNHKNNNILSSPNNNNGADPLLSNNINNPSMDQKFVLITL